MLSGQAEKESRKGGRLKPRESSKEPETAAGQTTRQVGRKEASKLWLSKESRSSKQFPLSPFLA